MTMARATFLKAFRTWSCWQIWGRHHEEKLKLFLIGLIAIFFMFELLCAWLEFCCLKHETCCCDCFRKHLVYFCCHGTWWEPGKKLRRNLSLSNRKIFRGIWCHDYRHIAPSCHDIDSNKTYHTSEIFRMDQTLKGGQRSMRWWSCESCSVLECPSPLPHSVPILASPDPDCERFSFRTFWICCAVTVNCTSLALNLRWVAWVILFHLRFLFIRLPSTRRCGLAETVGLCFRVDSDRATLGFVLGLVCVCVCFVLFCFVLLLFCLL